MQSVYLLIDLLLPSCYRVSHHTKWCCHFADNQFASAVWKNKNTNMSIITRDTRVLELISSFLTESELFAEVTLTPLPACDISLVCDGPRWRCPDGAAQYLDQILARLFVYVSRHTSVSSYVVLRSVDDSGHTSVRVLFSGSQEDIELAGNIAAELWCSSSLGIPDDVRVIGRDEVGLILESFLAESSQSAGSRSYNLFVSSPVTDVPSPRRMTSVNRRPAKRARVARRSRR